MHSWRTIRSICLVAGLMGILLCVGIIANRQKRFPERASHNLIQFTTAQELTRQDYDSLFIYFLQGFETYRTPLGAGATYPGLPSFNGSAADRLEGFSRSAPLWGAWIHSGRPRAVVLPDGHTVDLITTFREGLLAGTDPKSPEFWGWIQHSDQRIVEASDIAIAVWEFRDTVWDRLSDSQRAQIAKWLLQVNGKKIPDNNWHLFVVTVNEVLAQLGGGGDRVAALQHYRRMKDFYRGDGWFSDGPGAVFDYYNAWGIHYQLFWLNQVDPKWDPVFLTQVLNDFVSKYQYFIAPNGFPIMGRSVCYRLAAPVPLVLSSIAGNSPVPSAQAKRALDVTWRYFIKQGAITDGRVTQGYCGDDARVLDNYSGPASCLWSLRSLIAAIYISPDSDFWSKSAPLPVESADYKITVPATGWVVSGSRSTQNVTITIPGGGASQPLIEYSSAHSAQADRPNNHQAAYGRSSYSSGSPFCGCVQHR